VLLFPPLPVVLMLVPDVPVLAAPLVPVLGPVGDASSDPHAALTLAIPRTNAPMPNRSMGHLRRIGADAQQHPLADSSPFYAGSGSLPSWRRTYIGICVVQ
jgi:hypothetical protein